MILFTIMLALQQQRQYSLSVVTVPDQRAWAFVPSKETPALARANVTNTTTKKALVFQLFDFSAEEEERIAKLLYPNNHREDQHKVHKKHYNNDTATSTSLSSTSLSSCETQVLKCAGISDLNATCLYANLYIHVPQKRYTAYTVRGSASDCWFRFNQTIIKPNGMGYTSYTVKVQQFPTAQALDEYCQQEEQEHSPNDGLYAVLETNYNNIGHDLFDGLWPMYLGMVELGMKPTADFHVVVTSLSIRGAADFSEEALQAIAHGRVTTLFGQKSLTNMKNSSKNDVRLPLAVMGAGRRGQRTMNAKYKMWGAEKWLQTFRDRIYNHYGISTPMISNMGMTTRRVHIFYNKRYTTQEKMAMQQLIQHYNESSASNDKRVQVQFIDWSDYPTFYDQFKVISQTDVYVSGPGTGLMFSTFLPDGAVVINLGHYPMGYMEEYLAAGSPHLRALYYDRCRHHQIEYSYLQDLVDKAVELVDTQFAHNDNNPENRSPVGHAFVDFMRRMNPLPRNALYDVLAWGVKGFDSWAEELIFEKDGMVETAAETYGWNESQIREHLAEVRQIYNLTGCFGNGTTLWPVGKDVKNKDAYLKFQETKEE